MGHLNTPQKRSKQEREKESPNSQSGTAAMPTAMHMEISDESPLNTSPVEHSTPKEKSPQRTPLKQRSPCRYSRRYVFSRNRRYN